MGCTSEELVWFWIGERALSLSQSVQTSFGLLSSSVGNGGSSPPGVKVAGHETDHMSNAEIKHA